MVEGFHSVYSHGFVRVAVCVPADRVANPYENVGPYLSSHENLRGEWSLQEWSSRFLLFPLHLFIIHIFRLVNTPYCRQLQNYLDAGFSKQPS